MKKYIYRTVFFLCILGLAACDQEPLFWDIAHEYPPIDPIVGGAPSEIVPLKRGSKEIVYVSNGTLWEYDLNILDAAGKPYWVKSLTQPPGAIKTIASISTVNKKGGLSTGAEFLYALCWDGTIWKWNGTIWASLGGRGKPESGGYANIFGAGDYLFAGTNNVICSIDGGTDTITEIASGTSLLSGAVYNSTYFLATRGTGVYSTSSPGTPGITSVSGTDVTVLGLMLHSGSFGPGVYAVGDTTVWHSTGSTFSIVISGPHFTGGITSWTDGSNELLLLGLSRSSGTFGYGYREFNPQTGGIQTPGAAHPSSVVQGMEYISAIGDHAVNYLYTVDLSPSYFADNEGRPVVFASTVKDGLWSYRMRRNTPQWNGEDNSD